MKTSDKSRDQLVDEIEALKARLATVEALESELPTIFRVAMQQTPASIAIIDFEGNLKYINPAVKRSHGYDPDELIGKHLSIFHSSDQLPDVEAFVNEVRTTGKATAEIGHTRRDGTTFPALMQGCLLHDGSGNPIGMLGTLSDISDLKRMEAKLLESEERHCKWLDHAGDAVFIFDAGGRFTRVNNRACESLGYSPDELLALKVWDVEIGWKRKELEALFQVVLKSPPAIKEGVQRRRDGSTFPVEVRIGPVREESEDLILVIARDISERRRVEEKLRAAQEFLEKVMDLSPFAMWIADSDGTVLQTNQALRRSLDLADEQIVGKYNVLEDGNLEEQGLMSQVKAVFEEFVPCRFTISWSGNRVGRADLAGARDLEIDVSMFPILDKESQLTNVVCQWVDVTKRKRAEDERDDLASVVRYSNELVNLTTPDGMMVFLNERAADAGN